MTDECEHSEIPTDLECEYCLAYPACPAKRLRRIPRPKFKTTGDVLEFYRLLWDTFTYDAGER